MVFGVCHYLHDLYKTPEVSQNRLLVELLERHIQNKGWEDYKKGRQEVGFGQKKQRLQRFAGKCGEQGQAQEKQQGDTPRHEHQAQAGRIKLTGSVNRTHPSGHSEQAVVIRGATWRGETWPKLNGQEFWTGGGRRSSPAAACHPGLNLTGNSKGMSSAEAFGLEGSADSHAVYLKCELKLVGKDYKNVSASTIKGTPQRNTELIGRAEKKFIISTVNILGKQESKSSLEAIPTDGIKQQAFSSL